MSFDTSSEPRIVGMEFDEMYPVLSTTSIEKTTPTMLSKPLTESTNLESCSLDTTSIDTTSPAATSPVGTSLAATSLSLDNASLVKPWLDDMETSHPTGQSKFLESTEYDYSSFARLPWSEDQDQTILGPYEYYSSQQGKNMRSRLIDAFNAWLEVPTEELTVIKKVVEMLHNASLLIDDIQDSSDLRRGLPVAHHVYGIAQTINSANYVYFCAFAQLSTLKSPNTVNVFIEELQSLHRGQGIELFWRDTVRCPTEDEYLTMVSNKTGGLLRLAVRLMQNESQNTIDYVPLADLIGIVYQIRDDYLNLCSKEYSMGKGLCEDLTEGKFSFPIIHSIRSEPSSHRLLSLLQQKTKDPNLQQLAVASIEHTQSFQYCRDKLALLTQAARKLATDLDGSRGKDHGIQKILDVLEQLN